MFPTGTAGAALLVLRVSAAVSFVVNGSAHWALMNTFWIFLGFAIPALSLCFGFLTPYFAAICGLVTLGGLIFFGAAGQFHLLVSIADFGILAVLGPGAYSIDARIFGRRLIRLSPRK